MNQLQRKRLLFLLPMVLFALIGAALAIGLTRNASTLPSALLDQPAPQFTLPGIAGRDDRGLSTADLKTGQPILVNVFASWCGPCRIEHPILMRLHEEGWTIYGINQRDTPANAMAFLNELGDPYTLIGADADGRAGIEWGVYGVPETFILSADGTIVHKHVGPIHVRDLNNSIYPILEAIR